MLWQIIFFFREWQISWFLYEYSWRNSTIVSVTILCGKQIVLCFHRRISPYRLDFVSDYYLRGSTFQLYLDKHKQSLFMSCWKCLLILKVLVFWLNSRYSDTLMRLQAEQYLPFLTLRDYRRIYTFLCTLLDSIMVWAKDCPFRSETANYYTTKIVCIISMLTANTEKVKLSLKKWSSSSFLDVSLQYEYWQVPSVI